MAVVENEVRSARNAMDNLAVNMVRIDDVRESPDNARKHYDQTALQELADSIREHGILQPPVVRIREGGGYELIAGHRRRRAALMAGLHLIPVIIREDVDRRTAMILSLTENLQRQDIDPIEEAEGYAALRELECQVTEIAAMVNRSASAVSNAVRLLKLPEAIREHVRTGELSVAHGKALVSFAEYPKLLEVKLEQALSGKPSKDIERIDYWQDWDIRSSGAVVVVRSDMIGTAAAKECLNCQARRKKDGDGWLCLKPECFEAKRQAWDAEQMERLRERNGGKDLPRIAGLKHGTYQELRGSGPEGCKPDCEHRCAALAWSNTPIEICTKPGCYNRLANATHRAEAKERRDQAEEFFAPAWELLDAWDQETIRRATVLICQKVIAGAYVDQVRSALKRTGIELDINVVRNSSLDGTHAIYEELAKLRSGMLIALTAEVMLQSEASDMRQNAYRKPHGTRWFLGLDPLEQALTCQACGKVFRQGEYGAQVNEAGTYCSRTCADKGPDVAAEDRPADEPEHSGTECQCCGAVIPAGEEADAVPEIGAVCASCKAACDVEEAAESGLDEQADEPGCIEDCQRCTKSCNGRGSYPPDHVAAGGDEAVMAARDRRQPETPESETAAEPPAAMMVQVNEIPRIGGVWRLRTDSDVEAVVWVSGFSETKVSEYTVTVEYLVNSADPTKVGTQETFRCGGEHEQWSANWESMGMTRVEFLEEQKAADRGASTFDLLEVGCFIREIGDDEQRASITHEVKRVDGDQVMTWRRSCRGELLKTEIMHTREEINARFKLIPAPEWANAVEAVG